MPENLNTQLPKISPHQFQKNGKLDRGKHSFFRLLGFDYITILEYIITTFEEDWKSCPKILSSFLHSSLIMESRLQITTR